MGSGPNLTHEVGEAGSHLAVQRKVRRQPGPDPAVWGMGAWSSPIQPVGGRVCGPTATWPGGREGGMVHPMEVGKEAWPSPKPIVQGRGHGLAPICSGRGKGAWPRPVVGREWGMSQP